MSNWKFRNILLVSTVLTSAALAAPATAQTVPPPAATDQAADTAETADKNTDIVVTGSLIRNPNLSQTTPVLTTTAEEIGLRQTNTAEETLREIPGVVPSIGSAVNNGNGGASFVDLRGLGSNRNIVLLDGDRIAPSGLVGRVDLNNIPQAMIERVDVLTGGASTTYGADAVAGVVNFVTKKNFAGVELSLGSQITQRGDGPYKRADLTVGGNFADDRGNATISVGYQTADPVYQGDRPYSVSNIDSFSGAASGSGTTAPARFTRPGSPTQQIDGNGALVPTYKLFNFNPYNIYQTPFKRYNVFAQAHYDISDAFQVYTRALYSKNTVQTIIAPSGDFGSSLVIPYSNPYLPAAARNQFCASNGLTAAQCTAAAAATSPTDPNFRTFTTNVSRRMPEVGSRVSDYITEIFDYRAGVRGDLSSSLHYDVSGGYGESSNSQSLQGYVLTSRVRSAAYATNTTTCLGGAPGGASITAGSGCVPVNLFGDVGSITAGQIPYLTGASSTVTKTSLLQAKAVVSGDVHVHSPIANDGISFAVGGEYRKYTGSTVADSLAQTPGELGGAGGAVPTTVGSFHVYEGFGEIVVPLVQDRAFFKDLTARGGARYSAYTVNAPGAPKFNTTTYKGELAWSPVRDLKFRGTYARAVRAPNLGELFTPVSTGLTSLALDPCASLSTNGTRTRAAPAVGSNLYNVCLAQGATAGNIANIQNPTAAQANITTGGNPNVKPETSDSITAGVVIQPSFFSGFNATVDYYHIKIKNAITTPTPGDLLAACFGGDIYNPAAGAAGSASCTAIRRNPVTGGLDGDPATTLGLSGVLTNQGKLLTDGIDLSVNYHRDLGFARLSLGFNGNYTFRSQFQSNQNDTSVAGRARECVGYYSLNCGSILPKFQWSQRTTLGFDAFDLSLLWRHIDAVNQEPRSIAEGSEAAGFTGTLAAATGLGGKTVNFGHIRPFDYFDLTGRVNIKRNFEMTVSVQNLFDVGPPIVGTGIGATSFNSGNTYPSTYDALGRRFAVGVKVRY
ncbi:TonB-dependent receptor [Sphingomonas sp. TREG-RG-20F-R18-01]|uniref:TonB-dependent receptor domain-containing protein n=1 Tax=Sphingomonas sp. TREG-RG-20F-R18-01 TaxID=2914982 RepID=UPI001F56BACC